MKLLCSSNSSSLLPRNNNNNKMHILIYSYLMVVANATPAIITLTESNSNFRSNQLHHPLKSNQIPTIQLIQSSLKSSSSEEESVPNRMPNQQQHNSHNPGLDWIVEPGTRLVHGIQQNATKLMYGMPDPWKLDEIKPKLVFYKTGILKPYVVEFNATFKDAVIELNETGFFDSNRLVMITHGFHNDITTDWLTSYKDKILNISRLTGNEQTVALLGWGDGANILVFRYRQAAANVFPVAYWLGNFTKILKSVKPDLPIYGIGHSLGAHVMGVAGRCSKQFERITGLDPAGPCFEKVENSESLNPKDAKFVDIIHTDGYDSKLDPSEWFFPVNHYGMLVPIGTVDFYPNFGYHQPNAGTFKVAGSHLRALELFDWSIDNPGRFVASEVLDGIPDYDDPILKTKPAMTKLEMGYHADPNRLPPNNQTTLYYIKTNGEIPWV